MPRGGVWRSRGSDGPYEVPTSGNFSTLVVLPSFMVSRELADGRLKAVLPAHRRGRIGVYAVLATRRQLPLRTRLFIEHLAAHFADPRW